MDDYTWRPPQALEMTGRRMAGRAAVAHGFTALRHVATCCTPGCAGDMTGQLISALPRKGTCFVYGGLSQQPVGAIPPMDLIYHQKRVEGWLLPNWLRNVRSLRSAGPGRRFRHGSCTTCHIWSASPNQRSGRPATGPRAYTWHRLPAALPPGRTQPLQPAAWRAGREPFAAPEAQLRGERRQRRACSSGRVVANPVRRLQHGHILGRVY